ncbi:hypothetical protein NM208_g12614 [Fusarium decemcellulare]|uniref:Uncharacterized protein n=1 Tax=Fusarium decemcellulare TaxID=57161 RepID=A0ACC1RRH4_9HYPO|nr:hypothetical protein NM208_g12614 [Fusarium decemcellulare]
MSVRQLAQRLGRLEELMEKLAEQVILQNSGGSAASPSTSSTVMPQLMGQSIIGYDPISGHSSTSATRRASAEVFTPNLDSSISDSRNRALYALFPHPSKTLTPFLWPVPGHYVTTLFHCQADISSGKAEPPSRLSSIPPAQSHPTALARRLLQLSICMQQLSPRFDTTRLSLPESMAKTMENIVEQVSELVTSNDHLIASLQGLECLILLGYWHSNAGNLRKAWLIFRRALSLCQLLGADRGQNPVQGNEQLTASPQMLWFRTVSCDRYLSLLLGLPIGYRGNDFASKEATERDTDAEKLEKLHTVISANIIERNSMATTDTYSRTRDITLDMRSGAAIMGQAWWEQPVVNPEAPLGEIAMLLGKIILQMNHHLFLILLHVPYMLTDSLSAYEGYSRETCVKSSREVLKRFNAFRDVNDSAFSCRHVDYAALIAAITLLMAHVPGQGTTPVQNPDSQQDKKLIAKVKERMDHIARLNNDSLSQEASAIIDKLLPLLEAPQAATLSSDAAIYQSIQLHIPYFGTINITKPPVYANTADTSSVPISNSASLVSNTNIDTEQGGEEIDEVPLAVQFELDGGQDLSAFAPLAEASDWTLQGVDATYWSLLQGGSGILPDCE